MQLPSPRGVIAPILTPFDDDLIFASDLYLEHAQWLLDQGMHYLAPFGTTGEALSLSVHERKTALNTLFEGGIDPERLIPGTGLCNLPEALELCLHAVQSGCAGVMMLPPFYYKNVTEGGLCAYFDRLIHSVNHPGLRIFLYHIPSMAGVGFPPTLASRLTEMFPDEVVAYKDSSGDFDNTLEVLEGAPSLSVFPGSETFLRKGMEAGGAGCISATCNINPAAVRTVYDILDGTGEGDLTLANDAIVTFRKHIEGYAPIPAMKGLLAKELLEPRWCNVRPPLIATTEAETTILRKQLGDSLQSLRRE